MIRPTCATTPSCVNTGNINSVRFYRGVEFRVGRAKLIFIKKKKYWNVRRKFVSLLKLVIKFIEVKWENSNSFLFEISFEFIKNRMNIIIILNYLEEDQEFSTTTSKYINYSKQKEKKIHPNRFGSVTDNRFLVHRSLKAFPRSLIVALSGQRERAIQNGRASIV